MTKKKKKESWKERRQRAALKHQKAAEAERLRKERQPKRSKSWSGSKVLGVVLFATFLLAVGAHVALQNTQPQPNESELPSLYMLYDSDFSEFRGKVVVVDCFATWCQPCLQEIPHLAQIYEEYSSNEVIVISVGSSGDSEIELRQFKEDHSMEWRVARDTVGVFDKYNVQYIPTIVILSQSGAVHFQESKVVDASTLSSEVDTLLGG